MNYKQIGNTLFNTPELGFKEHKTAEFIINYVEKRLPGLTIERHAVTGLKFKLGSGKKRVGIIAELDAVFSTDHFAQDRESGAAHNCGHYYQVVTALALFDYLAENIEQLNLSYVFIFTPAEEFLDLDYRLQLYQEGKIRGVSGKIDMIYNHLFDDIDVALSFHSMVNEEYSYDVDYTLAGFNYIEVKIFGKTAHAGVEPEKGINALDAAVSLYQKIREIEARYTTESLRCNPTIESDNTLNIVPGYAKVASYFRYLDTDVLIQSRRELVDYVKKVEVERQVTCEVSVDHGYLPLKQSKELNALFIKQFSNRYSINRGESLFAGGDMGDLSFLIPSIQIGVRGWKGAVHGSDFKEADEEFLYRDNLDNMILFIKAIDDSRLNSVKLYRRSVEEYRKVKEYYEE